MLSRLLLLLLAVAVAVAVGRRLRAREGTLRPGPRVKDGSPGEDLRPLLADLGAAGGSRATLLQFSSAFCAPCRATRSVLARVAETVPGVAHVEVDAEAHLDLVRRLGVQSTPTTLVLDGAGREVRRATGRPTPAAVLQALPS